MRARREFRDGLILSNPGSGLSPVFLFGKQPEAPVISKLHYGPVMLDREKLMEIIIVWHYLAE